MQKISPFLWFNTQAEEAAEFYVSVFEGRPGGSTGTSTVTDVSRYGDAGPGTPGSAMTVSFRLEGQEFTALNGGPEFGFTEAISLFVSCEDQAEVDYFWKALSAVADSEQCGWLKDKFGLSWQIIPRQMGELLGAPNKKKSLAATNAMLKMKKIVIADLQRAFDEA